MKKLILLAVFTAAFVFQASAEYIVPAPITEWYIAGTGEITNENTTAPVFTSADLNGQIYGVFPDVTLEVGDTIAYTFTYAAQGTTDRINDLRWALWNNVGAYGTNIDTANWTGFWGDENSLQSRSGTSANPFNFGGQAASEQQGDTKRNTIDSNGTFIYFLEIERTTETRYTGTARLFNTGVDGDTPITYRTGYWDNPPLGTNVFNTFGIYLSSRPAFTEMAVIPPPIPADMVRVEAAADGSADAALPAQTLTTGQSLTAYAIARDASGTFIDNTYGAWGLTGDVGEMEASWALRNVTGDVLPSDLLVQKDLRSAVFTGLASGTAEIICFGNGTNLVMSQTITVDGTAPTPTFNPPAGTYVGEQAIEINSTLPGSTIYYTTDGSTPTTNSLVYTTNAIIVSADAEVTIKAINTKALNADSAVATAAYSTVPAATWTSLASGSWTNTANWYKGVVGVGGGQTADFSTLNLSSDVTVTLDGNKKVGTAIFGDAGGSIFNWIVDIGTDGGLDLGDETGVSGITVNNGTTTINAPLIGNNGLVKDGPGRLLLEGANTYTGTTTLSNGVLELGGLSSINDSVSIQGGTLTGVGFINSSVTVEGGVLSAGTPAALSYLSIYSDISVSANGTVLMRISKNGGFPTYDYITGNYFNFGGTLVVTNVTSDGSALAAGDTFFPFSGFGYNGGFDQYDLPTLPAGLSWDLSQLTTVGSISVITGVAPPIFTPPAGGYVGAPTVNIICGTPGATIYYTTDGTAPNTGSPSGTSPIEVALSANTVNFQIQAYAVAPALTDSPLASATYNTVDSPVWLSDFGGSWIESSYWSNNVPANAANVTADFSTLTLLFDGLVQLDGPQTVGNLLLGDVGNTYSWQFEAGSSGSLTLAGTNTPMITVNNGTNNLISAEIAGSDGMIKNGPGTLTLEGDNTFTGNTTVDEGVLVLNRGGGVLPLSGSLTINSGATVIAADIDDSTMPQGAAIGSLPITINAGGTLSAAEGGARRPLRGGVTLKGGTVNSTGPVVALTWGIFRLDAGVVVDGGTNVSTWNCNYTTLSQDGGTVFDVADGGTPSGVDLLVSNSFVAALNWPATGGTGIIKNGAGTMRLTGTNTYQGPTIVNSGRFLVDGVQPTTGTLTAKDTGTLGGTGSAGAAAFEAGSFAELTLGSPLTLAKELVVATNGTLPVVKVNMPDDVAPGTYTLATYDATGSSGAFDSTPMIMSGSVAAGNVATISTGGGLVELVVGPDVSNPTLDYSIGSGQITFTWEGAYKLVAQTNSLNEGLGNVWYDYPGGGTSGVAVPIDPTSPAVFFQLQSQ